MRNTKFLEIIVGLFFILGILCLLFLTYNVSTSNRLNKNNSYTVYANFKTVSGLKEGASVTIAGVKVGFVNDISINDDYDARVTIFINNKYNNIPLDTSVSVLTQGLLGEKYLALDIGADEEFLKNGDEFDFTKSSLVIERFIDQLFLKLSTDK